MAKNKGKFGKGAVAVEEPDEFVSTFQQIGNRIKPHMRPIAAAVGAVTLIMIVYYSYSWLQERKERKATTALVTAFQVADRQVSEEDLPKNDDPNNQRVVYKTQKERSEAILQALDQVNSSTRVGSNARLLHASTLYDLGRHDEAAEMYRTVADSGVARTLKRVAREGEGYALEAKAAKTKSAEGYRQALEVFRGVQKDEKGAGYDVSLFHTGRLLAKLEKKDEAIAAFEKLMNMKPPSIFNMDAERRLAVLRGGDTYPKPKPKKKITPIKIPDTPDDTDKKDTAKSDKKDAAKSDKK